MKIYQALWCLTKRLCSITSADHNNVHRILFHGKNSPCKTLLYHVTTLKFVTFTITYNTNLNQTPCVKVDI